MNCEAEDLLTHHNTGKPSIRAKSRLGLITSSLAFWMIADSGKPAAYLSVLIFLTGFIMMTYLYIKTGRFSADRLEAAE